jgi:hypothetical protein
MSQRDSNRKNTAKCRGPRHSRPWRAARACFQMAISTTHVPIHPQYLPACPSRVADNARNPGHRLRCHDPHPSVRRRLDIVHRQTQLGQYCLCRYSYWPVVIRILVSDDFLGTWKFGLVVEMYRRKLTAAADRTSGRA